MIEALLFATPTGLRAEEISQKIGIPPASCESLLKTLQKEKSGSAVEIVFEGGGWRMRIRRDLADNVRNMVSIESEFDSSIVKTLAVIALKAPVKQSEVIKLRGNKAYDHILKLEEFGFISSKPHSRTKLLSIRQKFYDYFDIKKGEEKYLFERS